MDEKLTVLSFFQCSPSDLVKFPKEEYIHWHQVYEDVDFALSEKNIPQQTARTLTVGAAQMTGRRPNLPPPAYEVVGRLEYMLTNDLLTLTSWRGRPEFDGQQVFTSLMRLILNRNEHVRTVLTSLSGAQLEKFQRDVVRFGDEREALRASPVYQRLAELGFKGIVQWQIMQSPGSAPFLRFSVHRPAN